MHRYGRPSPSYRDRMEADLGDLWTDLPEGAMFHDAYAYSKKAAAKANAAAEVKQAEAALTPA